VYYGFGRSLIRANPRLIIKAFSGKQDFKRLQGRRTEKVSGSAGGGRRGITLLLPVAADSAKALA
jgi:hypothetical protein